MKQHSLMISQKTFERIHKNMLLNLRIMKLRKNMLRYHWELLMLFQTKIFIYMITITKRIKLKKQVKNVLQKEEAKQIPGVVDKSNKKFLLVLLKLLLQLLLLIQFRLKSMFKHMLNLMFKFMQLRNRIRTRNSKIKKFVRK